MRYYGYHDIIVIVMLIICKRELLLLMGLRLQKVMTRTEGSNTLSYA